MANLMEKEPVLTVGTVANFVGVVLALAVAYGANISDVQRDAIINLVGPAFVFFEAMLAVYRSLVYSPATHQSAVAAAYTNGMVDAVAGTPATPVVVPITPAPPVS